MQSALQDFEQDFEQDRKIIVHPIRLHGPWLATVIESFNSDHPSPCLNEEWKTKIPADWAEVLGEDFAGKVLFKRSFNRPTGLEPEQRIDLVVEKVNLIGQVALNGLAMGVASLSESLRIRVEQCLEPTNKLSILVEMPLPESDAERVRAAGGIVGEVRLEIHD